MEHVSAAVSPRDPEARAVEEHFGRRSPSPESLHGKSLSCIRAFRADATLTVSLVAAADNALTATYADGQGYEYRIDHASGLLLTVDRQADLYSQARPTRPETRLPVGALREIALTLITTQRPNFATTRPSLHPFEGNIDRELYLFRWEDYSSPLAESRTPPYIQVGLYADGRPASYVNTLEIKIET